MPKHDTHWNADRLKKAIRQDRNLEALRMIGNPGEAGDLIFGLASATGAGELSEARKIADGLDGLFASGRNPEDRDLGDAMIGNLLVTEGRYAEAFDRYENAIHPGEDRFIPHVRLFASIWRELGLAHFGDLGSVARLERWAGMADAAGETHLARLARTFALASCAVLGGSMPSDRIQGILKAIDDEEAPGLGAQALAAAALCGGEAGSVPRDLDRVIRLCLSCEGLKGEPLLLSRYEQRYSEAVSAHELGSRFRAWLDRFVRPVAQIRNHSWKDLFPELPERPFLQPMNCAHCDGRCCYDGVYIPTEEETRIRDFMKRYPEYFRHVPENFTEEGEWGFLFHGKRTLRRPHPFDRPDFPVHFAKTKCVLADPNGECSLQKAATENGFHPWRFKPTSCWEFPLIGLFNEDAMDHPHYFGVPDPGYCDEQNPGYVSFMPCAKVAEDGISWKRLYQNELQYFLYLRQKQR